MARKTGMAPTELDNEVEALVKRVGSAEQSRNFMREYSVVRSNAGATWVTVTLLADDEFCIPRGGETSAFMEHATAAIEVTRGQQEIPLNEDGSE